MVEKKVKIKTWVRKSDGYLSTHSGSAFVQTNDDKLNTRSWRANMLAERPPCPTRAVSTARLGRAQGMRR